VAGSPQRNSGGGSSSPGGGDFKAAVIAATDIVDVIGKTVALKRRGRKFLGLCPFHSEKSPSFNVDSERQFFHCFGCKAGGNVIDFVMKRDGLPFIDALRQLGEVAGLDMPRFGVSKEKSGERQQLLDANAAAVMFFENLLAHADVGAPGREYLAKRGINDESVKRFRIGVAPSAWDALLKSPAMKKFPPPLLATAGLVKPRTNGEGHYDTFRNRLMFPIRDEAGRTIAFGGRVMPGSDDPAKYLNSPETPLFSKSRCVFGLDLARQRIVETGMVAVVEGYTDVVMAHQFGVSNVVSILGTAMTEQHVALMRRFANKIVLLFDADAAGDMAVNRAVSLFLTQPIDIAIASMPTDVDPDEYLLEHGAEAFEKVLAGAVDALTFKWKLLSKQFTESDDLTARQRAVDQYLSELASARSSGPVDPMRWGMALQRVSRLTDMPVDQLNRMFPARPKARPRQLFNQTPLAASRHGAVPQAATDGAGEAESSEPALPPTPSGPLTGRDRAERWILGILLAGPEKWHKVQHDVAITDFGDPRHRKLAELYWQHQRDEGEPVFAEFLGELAGPGLTSLAVELVDEIESLADIDALLAESIAHLKEARARLEDRKLLSALRRTSDEKMPEQAEVDLLRQLQEKARKPDLRRG
jgi:DNA primase catalytic core